MEKTLTINGNARHFSADSLPSTLAELLDHLGIHHATVVAEINDCIIERKNFAHTPIEPGQSIELVRFVGGGRAND